MGNLHEMFAYFFMCDEAKEIQLRNNVVEKINLQNPPIQEDFIYAKKNKAKEKKTSFNKLLSFL